MGQHYEIRTKEQNKEKHTHEYADGYKHIEITSRSCELCLEDDCNLYGISHTGGFRGICEQCLEKIKEMQGDEEDGKTCKLSTDVGGVE